MKNTVCRTLALLVSCSLFWPMSQAHAQGVTTGSIAGIVTDPQKQAVHDASGTKYEAGTRGDGRFSIPGMRVGGPYTVTASLSGFQSKVTKDVYVYLGGATDLELTLTNLTVTEEVTVTA